MDTLQRLAVDSWAKLLQINVCPLSGIVGKAVLARAAVRQIVAAL